MKVYIGNYNSKRSWWRKLLGWDLPDRKVWIKVDRWDSWNADNTIAMLAVPILKQLRNDKHGSGCIDDEDVPEHLRSTACAPKENEWDTDENFHKRYEWVLDEIIWALNEEAEGYPGEDQFHSGEHDMVFVPCKDNPEYTTIERGPKDTYKLDREGYDKYHLRVRNGCRLFGKYFQTLWD